MVLAPFWHLDAAFTSDEGAYGWQVAALDERGWADPFAVPGTSWATEAYPLSNSERGADGDWFPYVQHPLWPAALWGTSAVAGRDVGLHLLSGLSVLAAAAAAWALAGELEGRRRTLQAGALWLSVSGPLLVHGGLLWAHAPSAAISGAAVLAGLRLLRGGNRVPVAALALGVAVAGGVLLRSEGLLFALALGAGLAAGAWRQRRARRGLVAATVCGVAAVAGFLVERAWTSAIVGEAIRNARVRGGQTGQSWLPGRVSGAWHELFGTSYGDDIAAVLGVVAMLGAGFGLLGLARRQRADMAVGGGLAAVALGARLILATDEPLTGLVAAWPVAVGGLAFLGWRRPGPQLAAVGVTGAAFAGAVLLTQYPEGGGLEWGGRFFSPLIVPVAACGALGLRQAVQRLEIGQRQPAGVLIGLLVAVWGVAGPITVASARARSDRQIEAVLAPGSPVVLTDVPALPRMAWRSAGQTRWLLVEPDRASSVLAEVAGAGVERVTVVLAEAEAPSPGGFSHEERAGTVPGTNVAILVFSHTP